MGSLIKISEEEEGRRRAQKMETVGQLAGGIAHDFNNLLTPIFLLGELIEDDLNPDTPGQPGEDTHASFNQVMASANRAKELVGQILAFSRQRPSAHTTFAPYIVVREALRLLHASLPTTITIEEDLDKDSGPISGDPSQLHQVILNLCINASHAIGDNTGTITLSLKNVKNDKKLREKFHHLTEAEYVRFMVKDNGEGMDDSTRRRIFEPFFTTKAPGIGTGLGLSVIRDIVNDNNGAIDVISTPGEGAIFYVYLPLAEVAIQHAVEHDDRNILGREHVLLVDDEAAITSGASVALEQFGYTMTVTTQCDVALDLFRKNMDDIDVVITDYAMPMMTGVEFATMIHALRPDIPVILVSGFSTSVNADNISEHGIQGFVSKPFTPREIAHAIREVCASPN